MLQNYNFYRAMSVFMENPSTEFGWRELSEKLKLGPPSTKRYMEDMEREGLIKTRKLGARQLYRANRESRKFRLFVIFDMLFRLENSGIVEFLNKIYGYPTIVLFGSYSTGEAVEESDVDIAVITESKKDADMKNFEKELKKNIQLFKFSREGLKKMRKDNPSLLNGIVNGIVISGRMDVV